MNRLLHPLRVSLALLSLLVVGWFLVAARLPQTAPPSSPNASGKGVVVITGANRGIGLELAKQCKSLGYDVIGTARTPDEAKDLRATGAKVMQLDVTDAASIAALAASLKGVAVEMLINNAGATGSGESIEKLDFDAVQRAIAVNCIGPMRVTQSLLPNLRAGNAKRVVSISSRLGSLTLNERGGYYGYRESKAALNMFVRSLAVELKPAGFTCIAMSPGWVRTDMGGSSAPLSPEESVKGMLTVISRLKAEDSGKFFSHDGAELAW